MFEDIFFPPAATKHRNAPLAQQRADYLAQLRETGASRATLRSYANAHFNLLRLLNFREGERIHLRDVDAAATLWSGPRGRRCLSEATAKARQRFVSRCIELVQHLGWLEEQNATPQPEQAELKAYEDWLRNVRGLSDATIEGYCRAAGHLLARLELTGGKLGALEMAEIDLLIGELHKRGTWSRRTIHDFAQRLRPFISFAEARGWCRPGLAAGVIAPGYMADENIPKGLKRKDVERLLASVPEHRPVDRRDRAILTLFISLGLRVGEVAGLSLDDFDWENELLRVRCPKPGRTQLWPLSQEVGGAVLGYLKSGRPSGFGRSLFFTSHAPIQPLGRKALGKIVRDRLMRIGVVSGRRGPHALRHAAAQHLLDQGLPIKVIGDFLGHRDLTSTAIYAKLDLPALREVAALDLEGLA